MANYLLISLLFFLQTYTSTCSVKYWVLNFLQVGDGTMCNGTLQRRHNFILKLVLKTLVCSFRYRSQVGLLFMKRFPCTKVSGRSHLVVRKLRTGKSTSSFFTVYAGFLLVWWVDCSVLEAGSSSAHSSSNSGFLPRLQVQHQLLPCRSHLQCLSSNTISSNGSLFHMVRT